MIRFKGGHDRPVSLHSDGVQPHAEEPTGHDQIPAYTPCHCPCRHRRRKLRNEVLIEVPDAQRRRRMTMTNTRAEHDRLVAELHALERPATVGLEPTGHYHRLAAGAGGL